MVISDIVFTTRKKRKKKKSAIQFSVFHMSSFDQILLADKRSCMPIIPYQILLFRGKTQSLAFFDLGFLCWISFADHTDVKYGSLALCSPSLYTCKIRAIVEKSENAIKEMYVTLHALL